MDGRVLGGPEVKASDVGGPEPFRNQAQRPLVGVGRWTDGDTLSTKCVLYHDLFSQRAGIILPKLIVESNPYSLQWCDKIKQLKTTKQSPEGWHSLLAGREPAKFPSAHRDNLHLESDKVRGRDTAYVKTKGRDRPECMFAHVSIKYLQKETKRPIQERTHLGQAF